jgi:hypothetical protein
MFGVSWDILLWLLATIRAVEEAIGVVGVADSGRYCVVFMAEVTRMSKEGRKVRRKTLEPESRKTRGRRSELADEELFVLSECVPKEGASGRGTNKRNMTAHKGAHCSSTIDSKVM